MSSPLRLLLLACLLAPALSGCRYAFLPVVPAPAQVTLPTRVTAATLERDGDTLVRVAELPSFPAAIGVVGRVGEIAESRDHHPDMDIRWRTVTFRCATHSAGGITALDVDLARAISEQVDAAR